MDGPRHPSAHHSCPPPPTTHTRQPSLTQEASGSEALPGPHPAVSLTVPGLCCRHLSRSQDGGTEWYRDRAHPHCSPTTDATSGPRGPCWRERGVWRQTRAGTAAQPSTPTNSAQTTHLRPPLPATSAHKIKVHNSPEKRSVLRIFCNTPSNHARVSPFHPASTRRHPGTLTHTPCQAWASADLSYTRPHSKPSTAAGGTGRKGHARRGAGGEDRQAGGQDAATRGRGSSQGWSLRCWQVSSEGQTSPSDEQRRSREKEYSLGLKCLHKPLPNKACASLSSNAAVPLKLKLPAASFA